MLPGARAKVHPLCADQKACINFSEKTFMCKLVQLPEIIKNIQCQFNIVYYAADGAPLLMSYLALMLMAVVIGSTGH